MSRITDYAQLTSPAGADILPIVDVDDTTMGPDGTSKQVTVTELLSLAQGGVTTFNGRSGAVAPASGDYTAAQVGAVSVSAAGAANGVATLDGSGLVPETQLPVDLTASDLQPAGGTASTGSVLKIIRADHVHPSWPWVFPVLKSGGDDTANIIAARQAGITYALNHQGHYELWFESGYYQLNAAPTIGGSFKGNAIVPLMPQSVTAIKPVGIWRGAGSGAGAHSLSHWLQQVPQAAGTVFVTTRTDGTNDVAYGPAFVVGGPRNGYGGGLSLFSNELIVIDGISVQVPWNGSYGGFGFFGIAEMEIISASCMAAAVPVGGTSYPNMGGANYGSITNQWPIGLQTPDVNNNDNANIRAYSSEGLFVGAQLSEHAVFETIRGIYNQVAAQIGSASGTPMAHGMRGGRLSAENCDSAIVGLGAPGKIDIAQLDVENVGHAIYDPSNYLTGRIGLRTNAIPGYGTFAVAGASGLRIQALDAPPGLVSTPPSVPAASANFANLFYSEATVLVTGGTGVAVTVDGMPVPSGVPFSVRSGGIINLGAYSAAPSWQWVLR